MWILFLEVELEIMVMVGVLLYLFCTFQSVRQIFQMLLLFSVGSYLLSRLLSLLCCYCDLCLRFLRFSEYFDMHTHLFAC